MKKQQGQEHQQTVVLGEGTGCFHFARETALLRDWSLWGAGLGTGDGVHPARIATAHPAQGEGVHHWAQNSHSPGFPPNLLLQTWVNGCPKEVGGTVAVAVGTKVGVDTTVPQETGVAVAVAVAAAAAVAVAVAGGDAGDVGVVAAVAD